MPGIQALGYEYCLTSVYLSVDAHVDNAGCGREMDGLTRRQQP